MVTLWGNLRQPKILGKFNLLLTEKIQPIFNLKTAPQNMERFLTIFSFYPDFLK